MTTEKKKKKICNLKYIKENKGQNRYVAVNVENSNTVEIRIFKGTLNADTFLATLQWAFNLVRVIKNNDISKITWSKTINLEFSKSIKEYCKIREIDNSYENLKDYSISEAFLQKKATKKLIDLIEKKYLSNILEIQNDLIKNEGFTNFENDIINKKICYDENTSMHKYSKTQNVKYEILKIYNLINKTKKSFIDFDSLKSYFATYISNIKYFYNDINHARNPYFREAYNKTYNLLNEFYNDLEVI